MISIWEAIGGQWRMGFNGPIALDYTAVKYILDGIQIEMDELMIKKIQVIEKIMINYFARKAQK